MIQRSIGRRQSENLVANHGLAIRIRIHDSGVAANQAADLEMAQRAQSIKGLGLYLVERLRQGLLGQGRQRNGGKAHLCRCPGGDHCHRCDVLHSTRHMGILASPAPLGHSRRIFPIG